MSKVWSPGRGAPFRAVRLKDTATNKNQPLKAHQLCMPFLRALRACQGAESRVGSAAAKAVEAEKLVRLTVLDV